MTVESEQTLLQWHSQWGGELTRVAIQRAAPVGKFLGWKAMAPVTQWAVVKHRLSCHSSPKACRIESYRSVLPTWGLLLADIGGQIGFIRLSTLLHMDL